MKKHLGALLFAVMFAALFAGPAEARSFANCKDLNKTYPTGVSQSASSNKKLGPEFRVPKVSKTIYLSNKKLDTDRNGIACETLNPRAIIAKPVPGEKCFSEGQVRTVIDRSFTCRRFETRLTWSTGVLNHDYVYSTDGGYEQAKSNYCRLDDDAGPIWSSYQSFLFQAKRGCPNPVRFASYTLGSTKPKTALSALAGDVLPCKISAPVHINWVKGFENPERRLKTNVLGRNAVIQVIPIYAPDTALPKNSPAEDYKKFFDFVKKYVAEVSDLPVTFDIRVPSKYLKFSKPLKPYGLEHKIPGPHPTALGEIMAEVDREIDFTGATTALVLVPNGTAQDVWQQGPLGAFNSNEGQLIGVSAQYPPTETPINPVPYFINLASPSWWVHEFYHVGVGLDDHYGDTQNLPGTVSGMGYWGLMSPATTDLLGWEKWILDYTADAQVACVQADANAQNIWLRPSSVNTTEQKLAVVPLNSSKVLVLESIRAAGLNHFLKTDEQGVLAYTVDLTVQDHGHGYELVTPRKLSVKQGYFPGSEAPLRLGESVNYEGVVVKVVESGNFGDVISVAKL